MEIISIFAILLAPLIAIQVSKYLENRKKKPSKKEEYLKKRGIKPLLIL